MKLRGKILGLCLILMCICIISSVSAMNPNNISNTNHTNETPGDFLGKIHVHVYKHYNKTTHKFEDPIKDATCSLLGCKEPRVQYATKMTGKHGGCTFDGKICGRYHLYVEYMGAYINECDINWNVDDILISPDHCECKC